MTQSLIQYRPKKKSELEEYCRRVVVEGETPDVVFVDMFDPDFELDSKEIKKGIAKMKASAGYGDAYLKAIEESSSRSKAMATQTGMKILAEAQKMLERTGKIMDEATDDQTIDTRTYFKAAALQNDTIRSIGGLIKDSSPKKVEVTTVDYKDVNEDIIS